MPGQGGSRCRSQQDDSVTYQCCPTCPLQWSEDGRDVLVHAELYKEKMEKNKQLFPELADLSGVAELQAWLLAYGFKLKGAK